MNKNSDTELKTIAYLGPKGTYSETAAEFIANSSGYKEFNPLTLPSILKVIETVDNNNDYIGIVPIENSIEGIVREAVDNLLRIQSDITITKELIIPISHALISKAQNTENITKIISYTQPFAQCQHYLSNNFPDAELIQAPSTSEAVRQLVDLPENYAAIGNSKAAEIYGLNIVAKGINDVQDNLTRFICIENGETFPTGNDKTSIAFSTHNIPGALVKVLEVFQTDGINLCYIESRPSRRIFGDYTFFIDFDGHIKDLNVQKCIDEITPLISFYKFLGSYPKAARPLNLIQAT